MRTGYGRIMFRGKRTVAHRVAWEIQRGDVPDGLCVLHKCDNPSCVNVDHLYIGTHQDNMRDRKVRNRSYRMLGEAHHSAKVTTADVIKIRELWRAGAASTAIAQMYGLTRDHARDIAKGRSWGHVA